MNLNSRHGFSLMEVMIASTVLVGSLIVLDELASLGTRNAINMETRVTAQMLCEQKLNQILTGIDPLQEVENEAFEENDDEAGEEDEGEEWFYTVELEPLEIQNLVSLKVIVRQDEEKYLRPKQYELVRWVESSSLSSGDLDLGSDSESQGSAEFSEP